MKRFPLFGLLILIFCKQAISKESYSFCFERWWPYSFVDHNHRAQGIEVDLIRFGLGQHQLSATFAELPFQRCINAVKSGHIDFVLHVDLSDDLLLLTESYADWTLTLAVDKARLTQFNAIEKMAPTIMLAEEYTYPPAVYERLNELRATVVTRSFYEENDENATQFFSVLKNSRIDAILIDKRWAAHMISRFNLDVELLPKVFHKEPQYIGYRQDRNEKAQHLQSILSSIPANVRDNTEKRYDKAY
ncbi:hypothetical protein PALB_33960 [Pseudoalteromonas luteoviolacea B = ATCC 29581]|nr:hypothetical protein PALB_33960 [Pseudoalteromonas luteoviolacea B = ATCC 29581]